MNSRTLLRSLKLRHVLFLTLLLSGLVPLVLSTVLLIHQSRKILRDEERDNLIRSAQVLSREVDAYLASRERQLVQLGSGLLLPPGPAGAIERLREPWVEDYLQQFLRADRNVLALRVLDAGGAGQILSPALSEAAQKVLDEAFEQARGGTASVYRFVDLTAEGEPAAVIAVPVAWQRPAAVPAEAASVPAAEVATPGAPATVPEPPAPAAVEAAPAPEAPRVIVEALVRLEPVEQLFRREARGGEVGVFLIDSRGGLLWSDGRSPEMERALLGSPVVRDFVARPMSATTEYTASQGGEAVPVLAQVSPVAASGWGLVVQKTSAEAFQTVNRMIGNAALSTLVLVPIALFFAFVAARLVSRPIQRLAGTSHQIAAGNFGGRVETAGLAFELADMAENFNRMSGYVESYVAQLRQAAQANRELFIGSLRAFAAAIDAKDPYTRGHSERVAALSRTIARHLTVPEEFQHKVWIGALLHDVGKIGVEDRILSKEGVLTPEEYDQMKLHTVMGAEILTPIEQLKEVIPAVRWHHESWNGRGYPDGLKGEQIPLIARIVAVADCFDAITTNRPYQQAYSLQFAVETITKLTGSRFDAKVVTAFLRAFEAGEVRAGAPRPARGEAEPARARAAS